MVDRQPCGCRSENQRWLEMCPAHRKEHDDTRDRWQAEHVERERQRNLETRYL